MYVKPTRLTAILLHRVNKQLADTMRPLNFLKRLKLKAGRLGDRELTRLEAITQDRLRLEEIVEYLETRLHREKAAA